MSFILISGILLGFFIIFSLVKTKKNTLPQRLLIAFWVFMLGIFFHFYGNLNGLRFLSSISYPLINVTQIFLPVLIFLYLKSIFYYEKSFIKKNIWHFIPTLIYFLFYTFPSFINLFTDPDIFAYPKRIDLTVITLFKTA